VHQRAGESGYFETGNRTADVVTAGETIIGSKFEHSPC
jgi:hypothetical protein